MFKIFNTFRKFIVMSSAISLIAAAALNDLKLNSLSFMDKEDPSFMAEFDGLPRYLASSEESGVKILYYPVSSENSKKIYGKWLVYKFTDENGVIERSQKIINLKLVGNSRVILDGDYAQEFRISYMTGQDTLALVKKLNKSYEILELRRYEEKSKVAKKSTDWKKYRNGSSNSANENETTPTESDMMELVVERVYNPSLNKEVLKGDSISGGVSKQGDESFNDLNVTVNFGPGKVVSFDIPVLKLKNGGQFETEIAGETVTGIVTNSGVEGYRLRIASGKYVGTVMNFVSDEQMEVIASQEEERSMQMDLQGVENNDYRDQVKEQIEYTQNNAADVRSKQAQPPPAQNDEYEAEYSNEENEMTEGDLQDPGLEQDIVMNKIEDSGFSFGNSNRNIASKATEKEETVKP